MTITYATLALLQAGGGGGGLGLFLAQIVLIIGIFYFLMIRPQQKQKQKHEETLRALKKGDEVITAGGIVGRVVHIREIVKDGTAARPLEDRVTIESGESRIVVERGRIARVSGTTTSGSTTT